MAVVALPREEEPQIIVPMIDVIVQMPGASPAEVEQRVTRPMEKLLWEIPGVEYVYSTSSPGMSMVIVRFYVGQDEEQAIVRLNQKLFANMDMIPPGVSPPMVKPRSIDDVPVMALTLWGARYSDVELRQGRGTAARRHQGGPGRLGSHDRGRAPAPGDRRDRPRPPLVVRRRPARRAARHPVRQHAPARGRGRQRRPQRDRRSRGLDRQRRAGSRAWSSTRARAARCGCVMSPTSATRTGSRRRTSPTTRRTDARTRR